MISVKHYMPSVPLTCFHAGPNVTPFDEDIVLMGIFNKVTAKFSSANPYHPLWSLWNLISLFICEERCIHLYCGRRDPLAVRERGCEMRLQGEAKGHEYLLLDFVPSTHVLLEFDN